MHFLQLLLVFLLIFTTESYPGTSINNKIQNGKCLIGEEFENEYKISDAFTTPTKKTFFSLSESSEKTSLAISETPYKRISFIDSEEIKFINQISEENGYLFVSYNTRQVGIIDVRDPKNPVLSKNVLSFEKNPGIKGMKVVGNYLYMTIYLDHFYDFAMRLHIYDISDKTNFELKGSCVVQNVTSSFLTNDYPEGIAVNGKYAYIRNTKKGYIIVDISKSYRPSVIGSFEFDPTEFIQPKNDILESFDVSGNYAYAVTKEGIIVYDFTNHLQPVQVGFFSNKYQQAGAGYSIGDISIDGTSGIGVSLSHIGLMIDFSGNSNPTLIRSFEDDIDFVRFSAVHYSNSKGLLYAGLNHDGFAIYDTTRSYTINGTCEEGIYNFKLAACDEAGFCLDNAFNIYSQCSDFACNEVGGYPTSQCDECKCLEGYNGTKCEIYSCGEFLSTDSRVCGGHGECVAKDQCSCSTLYGGESCENFDYAVVVTPIVISSVLLIVIITIIVIIIVIVSIIGCILKNKNRSNDVNMKNTSF